MEVQKSQENMQVQEAQRKMSNLQNMQYREEEQFQTVAKLQKILKEEYLLLTTQQQQKNSFQKKLYSTLFQYYRSIVNLGESTYQRIQHQQIKIDRSHNIKSTIEKNNQSTQEYQEEKRLFEDEGFGDVYTFIKEILLTLSKDPYLMMVLIQKYLNYSNLNSLCCLAKAIANSMYENIVDDDVFNKDILKIIAFCLKKQISDKKHYFQINFQQQNFCQLILHEIIERGEIKSYAKQVIKNTLFEIAKVDHIIDFKSQEEEKTIPDKHIKMMNKQSSKSLGQSQIKTNVYQQKSVDKKSKLKVYSEGLRQHDEKIRKGSMIKKKYKNCTSDQLLAFLGINQEINFPCFSCSTSQQMKIEEQINKQLGVMMNRSQIKNSVLMHPDSLILKNIVLIFFNDLFKMLYSMPPLMRITCKMLYRYLNQKFNNKNSLYVVADFVINFWLISYLRVDLVISQATKLSPYLQQNLEEVILVIKKIVRDNSKDINEGFIKQFHLIVTNLKVSIANYIHEIINIDNDRIDDICEEIEDNFAGRKRKNRDNQNSIKSFCVCVSITDIKKLIELIKGADKELNKINQKLFKRVQRIEMMSEGSNIFGDKTDKITGKLYRASKSYVLFTDLKLPAHLSIDYSKHYRDAFKNNKPKNVLKQVLLSLIDIRSYQQYYNAHTMQDFIFSIDIKDGFECLNSKDHISLRLKIQYLQILCRGTKISEVIKQLAEQTSIRLNFFTKTWQLSKACYLKAISSINFQNEKLIAKEKFIRSQIRRRKLEQFFSKNQIKLCLTSPKTRQKEIVLKTTLMKDIIEEYREKLWLQNQSRCIHTALNLDFIKSLTGEPEKQKMKYQSHFSNIMKFPQILCSLPEVKERFSLSEDNIGIKDVFFQFIDFIKNFIKSKEQQYSILLENSQWLQENIELRINKRLYEKLYPKYPLYDDIALYLRLKTLDWLSFDHFKIDNELRNRKVWQVAAANLRLIDKLRAAAEKLHCIEETIKIISNNYLLMSKNQRSATADDISPLMIIVLIMAAPKRLISSINFIQSFASPSKLLSKQGYCLTQLKAAVHFCDSVGPDSITLFEDKATNYIEFNRKIYEKEIQYGIYFLLGKRKDSPTTQKKKIQFLKQYFKKQQIQ